MTLWRLIGISLFLLLIHSVLSNTNKISINLSKNFNTVNSVKSWIYFIDKIETESVYQETYQKLDELTISRRKISSTKQVDFYDLPISQEYINKILNIVSEKSYNEIKWMNAITIKITQKEAESISKLPFVRQIEKVFTLRKSKPVQEPETVKKYFDAKDTTYGASFDQINQINAIPMHKQGFYGQGIRILVLDTGYRLTHNALKNVIVNDTYDFIHNRVDVDNHPDDALSQYHHGTKVLGLIAGNDSGIIHGSAPQATFLLAKTEDVRSETQVEEDNFVRAIEWGEQRGAHILSASLAYLDWYSKNDFNGIKGVTTKAINIAVQKGLICVLANGNSGPLGIGVPTDAFYSIGIGAVDVSGNLAVFSSHGPTADHRIKPEICARGVSNNIIDVNSNTAYSSGSGTSFAAPIVAGAISLLLNRNPTWNPYQVYHSVISTGSMKNSPNNHYGYGILDIDKASKVTDFPSDLNCNLNCPANSICYKQACICFDPQQNCSKNHYCLGTSRCLVNGTCSNNICQCNSGWSGNSCAYFADAPIINTFF
eukprot:gene9268-1355_t